MEMGERLRRKQKEVFLFCWTGYFLTYFGRLNLSVAMNAMALEFASGAAVIGLTGSVFFWVYAVGKLVNGYAGDYLDNRHQVFFWADGVGRCECGYRIRPQHMDYHPFMGG